MNKKLSPLEALEKLKDAIAWCCYDGKNLGVYKKDFEIIEKALKRLDELDKYNLAKGIKVDLKIIENNLSEDVSSDLPEAFERVNRACLKLAMFELMVGKDQATIKKLKDYENLKEEVKHLRKSFYEKCDEITKLCNTYEKKLKALEIIKEKGVAVGMLQLDCVGLQEYNDFIGAKNLYLTQEEYDLLKEVLLDAESKN